VLAVVHVAETEDPAVGNPQADLLLALEGQYRRPHALRLFRIFVRDEELRHVGSNRPNQVAPINRYCIACHDGSAAQGG
jgi:hypothetical protein